MRFTLVVGLLAALLAAIGSAQTFRGGISGIVTDQTGAIVPDAVVKASNEATGLVYSTTGSTSGEFAFADLPPGSYVVVVSRPGFSTLTVNGVPVSAGNTYNLSAKLDVAQVATSVEVSAAALTVESSETTLNTTIPTQTVQDLPINGRDYTQMIALSSGFSGYAAGANGSVDGARANQVNWQIEGTDNNDQWWNIMAVNQGGIQSIPGVLLPLDSIEEFSLQTQGGPESGRNPGGTINLIIKSGTNQLHGSAYYYNRNEALAAQSPFAPPDSPKHELRNQHFGFSLGGPIIKDKTFYFITYEDQRFLIGTQALTTTPTAAYQQEALQLLNQYHVAESPIAVNLLNALYPANSLTGSGTPNNYFSGVPETGFSHNGLVKLDHSFNSNNRLSFRWFVGQGIQVAPVGSYVPYYYQVGPMHVQNYSVIYNTILSPTISNQLLFGVSYFKQVFSDANTAINPIALGLNTGVTSPDLVGAPFLSIGNFALTGLTPDSGRQDITGHVSDALSMTKGKHQLRFGGELRRAQIDSMYTTGGRGAFFFNGSEGPWSGLLNNPNFDSNIAALADFMAGYVYQSTIMEGNQERLVKMNSFNLFAQDAWQATRKLTVNLGLRYEYEGPLHDGKDDLSVFNPSLGGLAVVGQQVGNLYPQYWKAASPRVGLAYQPGSGDLVIRAGFGIFFDTPAIVPFLDNSFSLATPSTKNNGPIGVEGNPAGANPVYLIQENGYTITPGQLLFPSSLSLTGNNVVNLFSVSPNFRPAYDMSYNMNIQKGLGKNAVLQVGYVGMEARRLLVVTDINEAAVGSGFISGTDSQGFTYQQASRPYFSQYPNFGVINQISSSGTSNYNSLQVTLRTRVWHGVSTQFNYTWAHSLDEITAYVGAIPQDSTNFKNDYGNSDFDIRHNFSGYIVYEIPGASWGPHWLTHDWEMTSKMQFRTGEPFTVFASYDTSGTGENTTRGDQVGNPYAGVNRAQVQGQPVQWINPAAFVNPAQGSFGTVGRNTLSGPGYGDVDLAFLKNIPIKERLHMQLRIELFNIFNRVNLAPPSGTIGGGFGQSSDTIGDYNGSPGIGPGEPFNTQIALKVIF
jgi:Carboxypeptidase regulatory-like domain